MGIVNIDTPVDYKPLEREVYEAIGAASVCWVDQDAIDVETGQPTKVRVFDSTRALEIAKKLLAQVEAYVENRLISDGIEDNPPRVPPGHMLDFMNP